MKENKTIINRVAELHPVLKQGIVRCGICSKSLKVKSSECLLSGWPKCCDHTMHLILEKEIEYSEESLEAELFEVVNRFTNDGLSKAACVNKLKYVLKSVEMS